MSIRLQWNKLKKIIFQFWDVSILDVTSPETWRDTHWSVDVTTFDRYLSIFVTYLTNFVTCYDDIRRVSWRYNILRKSSKVMTNVVRHLTKIDRYLSKFEGSRHDDVATSHYGLTCYVATLDPNLKYFMFWQ